MTTSSASGNVRPTRTDDSPVSIVPGRLYALGGTVALDGRISWFARDATGRAPISCYLLLDGGSALLIDTGLPVHRDVLIAQLGSLLEPATRLSILHTRIAEYDSVGNTAAVCEAVNVDRLYAHFPAELLMSFLPADADAARAPRPPEQVVPSAGDRLSVQDGGRRELLLLGAPLRLLLTFWGYDAETRTLFTSDSFGHVPLDSSSGPRVLTGEDDEAELNDVRRHLFTKFDWLQDANRVPLADELARLFETHDIEMIAPMHGCVLQGMETVTRHHELVQRALRE